MPRKPKTNQPETPNEVQGRDFFQTPNYAVDLLIPYIPRNITWVWEPACGDGKIVQRLTENGYGVYPSDIRKSNGWVQSHVHNFISDPLPKNIHFLEDSWCIITNPPFSLKETFYNRCIEHRVPFALLIPADYSIWITKAINLGAEKIIPERRIDFITPDTLDRIHIGEAFKLYKKDCGWKGKLTDEIKIILEEHYPAVGRYDCIDDVPTKLLAKYSTSQFHSMWLTWGFNLGKSETFVELTKQMKENI